MKKLYFRQIQRRVPYRTAVYFEGGHENAIEIMKWVGALGGDGTFCEWVQIEDPRVVEGIGIKTKSGGSIFLQAKEWLIKEDVGFSICSNERMHRDYVML
jgi:hypothetical protein